DPGKTMMANVVTACFRKTIEPSSLRVLLYWLLDLDAVALNHRIRQQLVRHFGCQRARLLLGRRIQFELEVFALADITDPTVSHRMQRVGDGLTLRVEHRWLQRDEDSSFHDSILAANSDRAYTGAATDRKTRSKIASTFRN